jgi:uncharacterized repeat protein (TIGR01451 family)
MRASKALGALLAAAILGCSFAASPALATVASAPAWSIQPLAVPTNFKPGEESGLDTYEVILTNSGGEPTNGNPITITDTLPAGLRVKSVNGVELRLTQPGHNNPVDFAPTACKPPTVGEVSTVTCEIKESLPEAVEPAKLHPSEEALLLIHLEVPPSAAGPLTNQVAVQGGGAEEVSATSRNEASAEEAAAGFEDFHSKLTGPDGRPTTGADSHPYQYTTSFALNTALAPPDSPRPLVPAGGDPKEIEVALPPGLIGNPTATKRCTAQQFNTDPGFAVEGFVTFKNECPDASAVGLAVVQQLEGAGGEALPAPLYNLVPPPGVPAQLGFQVLGFPIFIDVRLRSDGDYGTTAYVQNTTEAKRVTAASVTVWGTPADESHDRLRGSCLGGPDFSTGNCPAGIPAKPFFRLPSSCALALSTTMSFDSWLNPSTFVRETDTEPAPVGCNEAPFTPTIEAKPTTTVADSPSGLKVDLHLPQKEHEDPKEVAEADLKDATVTLPPGLLVNPASADGLAGCSEEAIGYEGIKEGRQSFSAEAPECPDAAKIGSVEIDTPLLDHPLPGAVYLAKQSENPFNSLLAIYITVNDPVSGVVVKLPGQVSLDPVTGQLTTTVQQSPQLPFEDFQLEFFKGTRAPLRTPSVCGEYATTTSLTPWTAPESGLPATPSDSFQVASAPAGGPCPTSAAALPNNPSFEAGTESPVAGAYSPFVLKLSRPDGSQELKGLNVTLPPGLIARLAGTTECSAAGVAQAQARSHPGEGALERESPSCPAASQLGTVTVGVGAGPTPFYAAGKAYLAGPYKGAPLSMLIVTPAVAGPFDLGSVAVRAAIYVDPESAQVTVKSDPIPTILQGIPLDVRSIAVKLDKPNFTLNPTSCEAKAITGEAISVQNQVAPLTNRFQVGGCQNLGFKPKLSLKLKGGTERNKNPALTATLTYPKGSYANVKSAQVTLPHSEFLDQAHIRTICTRVQFAASQCPAGSIYGYAKAETPLLEKPLEGPVYLRSSSHPLPDLVADLNGQIQVVLDGRVDSIHGGIRNSFEAVPDAPVSKFTLSLQGDKKGLLVNSTDICKGTHKATADFTGQNGKVFESRPELQASCPGKGRKKHKQKRGPKP